MISNLKRIYPDSQSWQFELTDTQETYYYHTVPQETAYLCDWDATSNTIVRTDKQKTYPAATILRCFRGTEPDETEVWWQLEEYLPLTEQDAYSKILRVLALGTRTEEKVVYPP